VNCWRSFSRIFGAPQPGYSRFNRTIVASAAAAIDSPGDTAVGCDP
jgi:hypothetical protein